MNKEEIIEMARHADREWDCDRDMFEWLETFAKLIAEKEREECAKVCETAKEKIWEYHEENVKNASFNVCINIAKLIRARRQE
jgi:hypothetical protein